MTPGDEALQSPEGWLAILAARLRDGQVLGAVGPGDVTDQIEHASRLAMRIGEVATGLDLGTGAGLPGLVIAGRRPDTHWVLVDASLRRTEHVRRTVDLLGWDDRVRVLHARAEDLARDPAHRRRYPVVVARSFGPPAVVAECAAPLVAAGGRILVSEPPTHDPHRWPDDGLAVLGLEAGNRWTDPALQELVATGEPEPRFPRKTGTANRRPLW